MENIKRILIVDDEMSIRLTTTLLLSQVGYEVAAVSSGQEALEKLSEFKPDVILLDILFPGRHTGIDLCRQIRGNPEWSAIKIIMITAVADRNTVIEVARAGACGYMVKPFQIEALKTKIEAVMSPPAVSVCGASDESSGEPPIRALSGSIRPRRGSGLASSRQAMEKIEE